MQQIYRKTPMPKCDFNKVAWAAASVTVSLQDNLDETVEKVFQWHRAKFE